MGLIHCLAIPKISYFDYLVILKISLIHYSDYFVSIVMINYSAIPMRHLIYYFDLLHLQMTGCS